MKLTKQNIASLSLPSGKSDRIVFDDELPGFGVRLRAGGKRSWVAQYRVGTKQRRVTLGTVETLEPSRARQAAKETLAAVHLGGDPQIEKSAHKARAGITLGLVVERYLSEHAKPKLRPRSYVEVERHLNRDFAPLKEVPVHKVRRENVANRLSEIARAHGLFASNRARASVSALFTWAMGEGLSETNPVIGTNKATEEVSRDHVLRDDELIAIWRCCREDDYGRIVKLLILTGQRREEVGSMVWHEVELANGLWAIPKTRTKNGLPHHVPLSKMAEAVVRTIPRGRGQEAIFGDAGTGFQGWSKAKASLDKRLAQAGVPVRSWRVHDLRRSVATGMAERLGVLPHVVEAVLNHVSGHRAGVAGIYNRASYSVEKRVALERWANHIASALGEDGRG